MATESKWGTKFTCFKCGCKFYDLNKSEAVCPKCGFNQAERAAFEAAEEEEEPVEDEDVESSDESDDEEGGDNFEDELPEMEEDLGYDESESEEEPEE